MGFKQLFLLSFILSSAFSSAFAQDERYFRDIFSGALVQKSQQAQLPPKIVAHSPFYRMDINGDGLPEQFRTSKRDNIDWFEIYDFRDQLVYEAELATQGAKSGIYKLRLVQLSPRTKAVLIHFYEGFTESTKFDGTARLYVATFEDNDINKIAMTRGPHFYHEFSKVREQYFRRPMSVNVLDYNLDGIKEISTSYGFTQYIMSYRGSGEWIIR
jgi:hypothetical protein